jgi:hypothetical protein
MILQQQRRPGNRGTAALLWAMLLVPMAAYGLLVLKLSVNFPVMDDFGAILGSLVRLFEAQNLHDAYRWLIHQNSNHRIVLTRLAALADWWIFGAVNLQRLTVLANAALPLLLLVFHRALPCTLSPNKKMLALLPCALLLFQPAAWESALWAMAALSNYQVMLFGLAALSCSCRGRFIPAYLLAALAVGSQANGLFVPVLITALHARRNITLAAGTLITLLLWWWFFHGYFTPPETSAPQATLRHPGQFLGYVVLFCGSIFSQQAAAWLWGGLVLALGLLACLPDAPRANAPGNPFPAFILFSVLTATMTAAGRGTAGLAQALAPRYAFYSALLGAVVWLGLYTRYAWTRRPMMHVVGTVLALGFSLFSWATNLPRAEAQHAAVVDGATRFAAGETDGLLFRYPEQALAEIQEAFRLRIYNAYAQSLLISHRIAPLGLAALPPASTTLAVQTFIGIPERYPGAIGNGLGGRVEHVLAQGDTLIVSGYLPLNDPEQARVLVLLAPEPPIKTEAVVAKRPDLAMMLNDPGRIYSGFRLTVQFASSEAAQQAQSSLCLGARSLQTDTKLLAGLSRRCAALLRPNAR